MKPGESIAVEDAIKTIVTKSANDVAVVVAEALGGSEPEFARMMTAKARALGMTHTNYHNASGLPDDRQITTAHDQAILARALQDRFPKYFHYFSTRRFVYRGKAMRNHNHLLGRVDGVDGIKTGYIRDSGFNIAVDVRRHHRHLVVVVFGGRTARARDVRVRSLIDQQHQGRRRPSAPPRRWSRAGPPRPSSPARRLCRRRRRSLPAASIARAGFHRADQADAGARPCWCSPPPCTPLRCRRCRSIPASWSRRRPPPKSRPSPPWRPSQARRCLSPSRQVLAALSRGKQAASHATTAADAAKARGGWMIQVGAFDDEHEAKQRLEKAQIKAKHQLGKADPFTERIAKGDKSLYRARFAGLDKSEAQAACKHLKRSDIPCMLLKN